MTTVLAHYRRHGAPSAEAHVVEIHGDDDDVYIRAHERTAGNDLLPVQVIAG